MLVPKRKKPVRARKFQVEVVQPTEGAMACKVTPGKRGVKIACTVIDQRRRGEDRAEA